MSLLLSGTLLVGCQSNPEPPPLERTATSTSPSPSPADAAPTMPPEAKGASKAAAKAFAHHFFDTLNFAIRTGETTYFRSLAAANCESCDVMARNIEKTYTGGGSIHSEGWILRSASLVPLQPRDRPILDLGVYMSPEEVTKRRSGKGKMFAGGKHPMTMYLVREGGEWRVSRLDLVA